MHDEDISMLLIGLFSTVEKNIVNFNFFLCDIKIADNGKNRRSFSSLTAWYSSSAASNAERRYQLRNAEKETDYKKRQKEGIRERVFYPGRGG